MNREVALKYMDEFSHWVKGGEILYSPNKIKNPRTWVVLNNDIPWESDGIFVINDKNVEFRKAFALGKKIEFRSSEKMEWEVAEPPFSNVGEYRISDAPTVEGVVSKIEQQHGGTIDGLSNHIQEVFDYFEKSKISTDLEQIFEQEVDYESSDYIVNKVSDNYLYFEIAEHIFKPNEDYVIKIYKHK